MCFPTSKPPADNSAEIARKQEEERQARIAEGRTAIDNAFAQFDDPFYAQRQQEYLDYYIPQIERQYADTARQLKLALARSGNLNSGSGARQLGNLFERYNDIRAVYANNAIAHANQIRGNVESTRDDLYQQNRSAADPSAIAASAAARATPLAGPSQLDPIGDLFSSALNLGAIGLQAERAGYPGLRTGFFKTPAGSSGRETVVR